MQLGEIYKAAEQKKERVEMIKFIIDQHLCPDCGGNLVYDNFLFNDAGIWLKQCEDCKHTF